MTATTLPHNPMWDEYAGSAPFIGADPYKKCEGLPIERVYGGRMVCHRTVEVPPAPPIPLDVALMVLLAGVCLIVWIKGDQWRGRSRSAA